MKLADSNVWLALAISAHGHNQLASKWLLGQPARKEVVFCRLTQLSLLRLLTTNAVFNPYGSAPMTNTEAQQFYAGLLADPRVGFAPEPPGLEPHWDRLARRMSASPKLWMDAYLAAFAIAGGHQLITIDTAFRQFDGLDLLVL